MFREKEIIALLKEIARKLDGLIVISKNKKIRDISRGEK
jgi:hypothetical protein